MSGVYFLGLCIFLYIVHTTVICFDFYASASNGYQQRHVFGLSVCEHVCLFLCSVCTISISGRNWLDFEGRGFKVKVTTRSDVKNFGTHEGLSPELEGLQQKFEVRVAARSNI